jgi:nitrate reductase beta subunit
VRYLANLLSAGDETVIRTVLKRLAAMRSYMRERTIAGEGDPQLAAAVGMEPRELEEMFRLLAIADYEDRFVVPPAHRELAGHLAAEQGACGLDFPGGPGSCEPDGGGNGGLTMAKVSPRIDAYRKRRANGGSKSRKART